MKYHISIGPLLQQSIPTALSQSGHLLHPKRSCTKIRTFERLIISKHCLELIYCDPGKVKELFLKRNKTNEWNENEERDRKSFLEVEKKIYLQMFPHNTAVVEGLLEEAGKDVLS